MNDNHINHMIGLSFTDYILFNLSNIEQHNICSIHFAERLTKQSFSKTAGLSDILAKLFSFRWFTKDTKTNVELVCKLYDAYLDYKQQDIDSERDTIKHNREVWVLEN